MQMTEKLSMSYQTINTNTLKLVCHPTLIIDVHLEADTSLWIAKHPLLGFIHASNTYHKLVENVPATIADLWTEYARSPDAFLDEAGLATKYHLRRLMYEDTSVNSC